MSKLSVGSLEGLVANNNVITLSSGHKLYAPGSVVQVVTANSNYVNQTISSTSPVLVTGLTATITPKFANSKIVIEAMLTASWTYVCGVHIYKNGIDIVPNHGSNNQSGGSNAIWTLYQAVANASVDQVFPLPLIYDDLPGTTATTTYDIRMNAGWSGAATTMYVNNRNTNDMLGTSFMKITEVAQ